MINIVKKSHSFQASLNLFFNFSFQKSLTLPFLSLLSIMPIIVFVVSVILILSSLLPVSAALAQNPTVNSLSNTSNYLTDKSIKLNATGSCDSTCDAMGPTAPSSSVQSVLTTRMIACSAGYTGNRTQTRTQNPDGSFTPWVDSNTSLCVCAPTYADTIQLCASPLAGTFAQRTNWTCSANVGSWGTPYTTVTNCFTPCAPASPASETSSGACPSGYTGSVGLQRDSSCPSGNGTNSSPVWGAWYTTSNSCVMENSCPYPYTWCSGPMGRNTGSYPQGSGRCYSWGFSYSSGSGTWCKAMGT